MAPAQLGYFSVPEIKNEPLKSYSPGSPERIALQEALKEMEKGAPFHVPIIVNGKEIKTSKVNKQSNPSKKDNVICTYEEANEQIVSMAIDEALKARQKWETMPFGDRAAIFLKAAELLSSVYRYKLMAATMLGQGKNVWQAEIDAACELIDFWRFNTQYAQEIYEMQPKHHSQGIWNRQEYRGLEGFIYAISPFNFTAIGGNLVSAPALMGNVVIWKPSPSAMYSNYLVYRILMEAGLPEGVIQFVPGDAPLVSNVCFQHPDFAGLHFTGSTQVFKQLWKTIALNLDAYKQYPRIVGETGGKNMHMVHPSADPTTVIHQTIRAAFEYQGQKCSACSRLYVPDTLWPVIRQGLLSHLQTVSIGDVTEFQHFMTPVINKAAFDKIQSYIDFAKQSNEAEIIFGGECNERIGYFIQPTVIVTQNTQFKTLTEEIFGPVLTVYVYPSNEFLKVIQLAEATSPYGLTCSLFAQDRQAIMEGGDLLRHAAGNFYINDKCTGAVVGQQAFGGSRTSGTNDKAGAAMNLFRWVSARSIKENFLPLHSFLYPSNMPDSLVTACTGINF